jgi:hypothetical protein
LLADRLGRPPTEGEQLELSDAVVTVQEVRDDRVH